MNTRTRASRLITAVLLTASVILVGPALTGCGAIKDVIEKATGGQVTGGTSVPEDFPDAVPLIEGEVLAGGAVGDADSKVWNVTIKVDDAGAFDQITTQLAGR